MWQNEITNVALHGMPLMDEMEELSERCGKSCLIWKDAFTARTKNQGTITLVLDLGQSA